MPVYKLEGEIVEDFQYFIKARSKKQALKKLDKLIGWEPIVNIDIEKLDSEELRHIPDGLVEE